MSGSISSLQAWAAIAESAVLCLEADTVAMQNRCTAAIHKHTSDAEMVCRAMSAVGDRKAATATRVWLARQKLRDQVIEDLLSCEKFLISTNAMCDYFGSSLGAAACAQNSLHAADADLLAAAACLDLLYCLIDGSQLARALPQLSCVCGYGFIFLPLSHGSAQMVSCVARHGVEAVCSTRFRFKPMALPECTCINQPNKLVQLLTL